MVLQIGIKHSSESRNGNAEKIPELVFVPPQHAANIHGHYSFQATNDAEWKKERCIYECTRERERKCVQKSANAEL